MTAAPTPRTKPRPGEPAWVVRHATTPGRYLSRAGAWVPFDDAARFTTRREAHLAAGAAPRGTAGDVVVTEDIVTRIRRGR